MLKCIDQPLVVGCSLGHKYSIVSRPMECRVSPHFSPFVSHYRPINIDQRVTLHCINYKPWCIWLKAQWSPVICKHMKCTQFSQMHQRIPLKRCITTWLFNIISTCLRKKTSSVGKHPWLLHKIHHSHNTHCNQKNVQMQWFVHQT